jgi:NitT/TauT family transport system substrate-binding protein
MEDEGIEIELTTGNGADKCMTALVSGSADIALMGPEATIYVVEQGKKDAPKVFGQLTKRDGSFIVSRTEKNNFTWQDLANSEILGGRRGGVPAMTLEYALKQNGLIDGQNITINYDVEFANMSGAFVGGTGDYVTLFEPNASELVKNGKGHIVASVGSMAGEVPFTAFTANESYISKNKDKLKKFLRAIMKGYNYLMSASVNDVVASLRASFDGTSDELLTISINAYKQIDAWSRTPVMSQVAYDNLMDIIIDAGTLTNTVAFSSVVDNTYAQSILADFA